MEPRLKLIVVKIGTNVITGDDGLLNRAVMRSIVGQIAALARKGVSVFLVSSGAMGAGLAAIRPERRLPDVARRQVLAAVGQVRLMEAYAKLFSEHTLHCAQVLATKEDFRDRTHYVNMQNCLTALKDEGIVPIINENDVVSVSELMFTDNDELAGLIATMMNVDALIILTSVDGVYDGDPRDPQSKLLRRIEAGSDTWKHGILPVLSSFGRGGMHTKCETAKRLAALGIETHIVNGTHPEVLLDVSSGKEAGTVFVPKQKTTSLKRWVAGNEGREKGNVILNDCARDVITSTEKIASLLPVGIVRIEGDFERGELVRLCDERGHGIGLGMAAYSAERARELIGKKGQKPLVHYDYLYLFP